MQNQKTDFKLLAVAAGAIVVVIIVLVVTLGTSTKAPASSTPTPALAPSSSPKLSAQPSFIGFNSLLDVGVSSDQVSDVRYAFYQYAQAGAHFSQASLVTSTITVPPYDPNNPPARTSLSFSGLLDSKTTYQARLEYFNLTAIELYLYDASGKTLLYDSKVVDLYHQ